MLVNFVFRFSSESGFASTYRVPLLEEIRVARPEQFFAKAQPIVRKLKVRYIQLPQMQIHQIRYREALTICLLSLFRNRWQELKYRPLNL